MGSLMAGWDAPIMDEHTARFQRNKSLTKEEINAFWRSKSQGKNNERDINLSPSGSPVGSPEFSNDAERRRAAAPFSRLHNDDITHSSTRTGDWWTRSNWAFLNEPPRDEMHGTAQKYTAQFDVAEIHN